MSKKRTNVITIILLILTFIGILVSYNSLPEIIPTHWGIDGKIDKWGSKSSLWMLYGIMLIINGLFIIGPHINHRKQIQKTSETSYDVFRIIFNIFFMAILVLNVLAARGNTTFNITRSIMFLAGLFIAAIGKHLPKFKPNSFVGIKTPWTLTNEKVWNKTHRMAGPIWVIGGIISAIVSLIVSANQTIIIFILVIIILVIIPTVYSYLAFKNIAQENLE